MKRVLLLLYMLPIVSIAQTSWTYNFDSATSIGTYVTGESTSFLPTTATNGGTARVRIGSAGGSFNLLNPGTTLGSNFELNGMASTSSSVNKFSIQNYNGAKVFSTSFKVRFDGGSSGTWYFFQGSGVTFTGNSTFSTAHAFSGLRFVFGENNSIVTSRRTATSWSTVAIPQISSQATNYLIEIFANNSTSTANYNKSGNRTLAFSTWDLWVDGSFVGNYPSVGLPNNSNIDSFTFYGENSDGNVANIFLDDIAYAIDNPEVTLPISLTNFTAKPINKTILLQWKTASESNNKYFDLQRSADGKSFTTITTLKGAGNSDKEESYSYTDENPFAGTNYYKLLQYDVDGKSTSKIISVDSKLETVQIFVSATSSSVDLNIFSPNSAKADVYIYDVGGIRISGQTIQLNKGSNNVNMETSLSSGIYFVNLVTKQGMVNKKFARW